MMEETVNMITAFLLSIRKDKSDECFSITKIFEKLKITEHSNDAILDTAKYMENLGLIEVNYVLDDALIKITTKGIIEFGKKPTNELEKTYLKLIDLGFENNFEKNTEEYRGNILYNSEDKSL